MSKRCRREIDQLERLQQEQRRKRMIKMKTAMDERGKRLKGLGEEMGAALATLLPLQAGKTAEAALGIFSALAAELPKLDGSNLHTYRKRLKQALYLAEMSATADPLARQYALAFRKIHLAAGEWHDWEALALRARRVLGRGSRKDGLVSVLNTLAGEALRRALALSRRSTARFLKTPAAMQLEAAPPKKPVASVAIEDAGEQALPAG
jgi:hypothetical protein